MGVGSAAAGRALAASSRVWRGAGEKGGELHRSGEPDYEDAGWISAVLQRTDRGGSRVGIDRGGGSGAKRGGQRMLGWDDGSGPSAGWRETGTGAGGRGISFGRKLSAPGREEDHGICGAGAGRQERERHRAEREKSAHASDAGAVEK